MPTDVQHLATANANETFAHSLDRTTTVRAEWAITILFYAAVHYIQAYFAKVGRIYTLHKTRDSAIQRDPNLSRIYVDYRELETYSRDARYDIPGFTDADFVKLLPVLDKVKTCVAPFL